MNGLSYSRTKFLPFMWLWLGAFVVSSEIETPKSLGRPITSSPSVPQKNLEDIMFEDPQKSPDKASSATHCQYPCKCIRSNDALGCKSGVTIIKDGCDCCQMCARQQGDLCDYKDKCDEAKGFYCDFVVDDGLRGHCRAKSAKHCDVNGQIYKDGQTFHLNCSLLCTCQNGQYACASTCPQEERQPSPQHCKDAQLVVIKGRCCREWVCPYSHSLARPEDEPDKTPSISPSKDSCQNQSTNWSACSVTCDMGVSIRFTNDPKDCVSREEKRLCLIRPCNLNDKHMTGTECKTTRREEKAQKLVYERCQSTELYRNKYCATCSRQKCCGPGRTKNRLIEFLCPDEKVVTHQFMWIQTCECKAKKNC